MADKEPIVRTEFTDARYQIYRMHAAVTTCREARSTTPPDYVLWYEGIEDLYLEISSYMTQEELVKANDLINTASKYMGYPAVVEKKRRGLFREAEMYVRKITMDRGFLTKKTEEQLILDAADLDRFLMEGR